MTIRDAEREELDALAQIWFDAWRDAHAAIVPAELVRLRTWANFRDRLERELTAIRVAAPHGTPVGFSVVRQDQLYQLFVSAPARGTGVAAALLADAIARFRREGTKTAWLNCAIGNRRAARFYEKSGWRRTGSITSHVETEEGTFPLEVWRYEISLETG